MSKYIDLEQIEFLKVDGNKEFNHGVDCCINRLLKAEPIKAVSLDKVKQAREEIENEIKFWSEPPKAKLLPSVKAVKAGKVNSYKHCLEILDKLIAESEEKE
jgi:hypothetical protein